METHPDLTARPFAYHKLAAILLLSLPLTPTLADDQDLQELLNNAKNTSAPPSATDPAAEPHTATDPLGTLKKSEKPRAEARVGTVTLNNHHTYSGLVYTTLATPFRLWLEENKRYLDIDVEYIARVDVKVEEAAMVDDWRWLKEGSDQKVFSGKKKPAVSLRYKFTLINGQAPEGTVVAPVFVEADGREHQLAFYKHKDGELGQTMADVAYIETITLTPQGAGHTPEEKGFTRTLPLLGD